MKLVKLVLVLIGAALFYPFPDIDIRLLGIGNHRYFFFHSAILPLLLFAFVKRKDSTWIWNSINGILCAFALGIGIHLIVDVFQSKSVVFPFAKTLIRGTSIDDRLWEGINGVLCFFVSRNWLSRNIGNLIGGPKT